MPKENQGRDCIRMTLETRKSNTVQVEEKQQEEIVHDEGCSAIQRLTQLTDRKSTTERYPDGTKEGI
ncbi:hypothetical protein Mapa_004185 [Marchantia paleacea]|nr:hypothetical protein Mapa_004185 [Marchantia paleacea]